MGPDTEQPSYNKPAVAPSALTDGLAACPFCGETAAYGEVTYHERSDIARLNGQTLFHSVNCIVCGTSNRGLVGYKTKEQAAKHWNTRAANAKLTSGAHTAPKPE